MLERRSVAGFPDTRTMPAPTRMSKLSLREPIRPYYLCLGG